MQFGTRTGNLTRARTHCLVVGIHEGNVPGEAALALDEASDGHIKRVLKRGDISGLVGQHLVLHDVPGISAQRVLLLGVGKPAELTASRFDNALIALAHALAKTKAKDALVSLADIKVSDRDPYWAAQQLASRLAGSQYAYTEMRGKPPVETSVLARVNLHVTDRPGATAAKVALDRGAAIAAGLATARDLGNTPPNICTPTYLARAAKSLATEYRSITTTVLEEKDMKKHGMGALLSVGMGSNEPSKLIIVEHKGGKKGDAPYALVGKGITFDTGGISLKQPATMYEMTYDMCGAASVLGTMKTVAELGLPINVLGVVAAAENMPSASATRPGDIVKTMSGQTVEILNTDAEGRLVLCDALTYIARYKPATVVDIATLTGAIVTALGSQATGLFANDDALADELLAAGTTSLDRAWRLPMWEEYQSNLNSPFADMANVGGRGAGSITAACFLARFTRDYRWAHLDCAGTAYRTSPQRASTGRPVPLLVAYLLACTSQAASA